MGLRQYHQKRDFAQTPEPAGKEVRGGKGPLRFVVQKHDASRLHYDFRLELDGTLKSWAIPKGPSLNPRDKRLAMQVEDHPLDYRTFEGLIPEGNYGAGTVMVWDEGTYCSVESPDRAASEKALRRGLQRGHLSFVLNGKKLHGEFSLIRMKDGKAWLLVKKEDDFAGTSDVTRHDRSARTRRTLLSIVRQAHEKGAVWGTSHSQEDARGAPVLLPLKGARLVKPMLATLVDKPFDRDGWIFEIKWDGYRAIAERTAKGVRLYSRNHHSFAERFAPIARALAGLERDLVLDGEIVAVDEEGRASFQLLQNYQRTGQGRLVYYVFDLLRLDGRDTRELTLRERKRLLRQALPDLPNIRVSEHIENEGVDFFRVMREKNIEGMIAKDGESPYREGRRSEEWLKIKTHLRQEAVIAGFTEPRGARDFFGSLVLGVYEGDQLVYIGHTGTGFDRKGLKALAEKMKRLVRKRCPFAECPKTNMPPIWLKPELVCEVSFQEWTEDGQMRQPAFEGLRIDKPARQVRRELPEPTEAATGHAMPSPRPGEGRVKLTHSDKTYWPRELITKGDLIAYYRDLAPVMLPYLIDRPQSLHRHPNGIEGESFFQKDTRGQIPAWIETVKVHSESGNKDIEFVLCQNRDTLLYLANLGCIEINPWNSRVGSLDYPDWAVIDLDPEKIGFDKVIETAQAVHRLLDSLEIESFCKTSGATGLHIYVPLGAQHDYEQAKQFAEIIANLVNAELPKTTSVVRDPKKRQRRIYIDFLQNRYGQTLAAPYSVRPRPGATVSAPLEWKEVRRGLDPTRFTLLTIAKRLDRKGDLFADVLKKKTDLAIALEKLAQRLRSTRGKAA